MAHLEAYSVHLELLLFNKNLYVSSPPCSLEGSSPFSNIRLSNRPSFLDLRSDTKCWFRIDTLNRHNLGLFSVFISQLKITITRGVENETRILQFIIRKLKKTHAK
ncbi:hypothetical protein HanIR_Chr07g0320551 [Helianthus annuus]|nr:hypothetical protein HanIR_Chr07g0320551 [Helianthus annuus]